MKLLIKLLAILTLFFTTSLFGATTLTTTPTTTATYSITRTPLPAAPAPVCRNNLNFLFLGNSLTSVNNIPEAFKRIAAAEGRTITYTTYAPGGKWLDQHNVDATTNSLINGGGWDYVVLQEQSTRSIVNYPAFVNAVIALNGKIQAVGAETLLYENWALTSWTASFPSYEIAFNSAAIASCTICLPAGNAWWDIFDNHNSWWLPLYLDDRHPSTRGAYLTACVFYSMIFGVPVTQQDTYYGLNAADSAFYHLRAWEAVLPWVRNIELAANDPDADEDGLDAGAVDFVADRIDNNCQRSVKYIVSGSAANGTDYQTLSGDFSFPVGTDTGVLSIVPYDDFDIEGPETVELKLCPAPGYRVVASDTAAVTIQDLVRTPTPTPTASATITRSLTYTESVSSTSTVTPTPTPSISPAWTITPTVTATPTPIGDVDSIEIYPNPAFGEEVVIRNLPENVSIKIFTITGELVRKILSEGRAEIEWDLKTANGNAVADGLYLVVVEERNRQVWGRSIWRGRCVVLRK